MINAPARVVTLLADLDGSTNDCQHLHEHHTDLLEGYTRTLRKASEERGGREVAECGERILFAFRRAGNAVTAAVTAQRLVGCRSSPRKMMLPVRMGLDAGEFPSLGRRVALHEYPVAGICALGYAGQILASESARALLLDAPPPGVTLRSLGVHRLRDLRRVEPLYQIVHPTLPAEFPPVKALDVFPNNLPVQLTSFIGREGEVGEVRRLLIRTRLLTLIGAGGCGKTRLALQLAADLLEEYSGGVWVVDLAGLFDPALIAHAVASAVGVREAPGRALTDALVAHLRPRSVLIVLDNCEHLAAACAACAETVVRACPDVRVLATSREPLRMAGEITYRVPSLSVPEADTCLSPEQAVDAEAVRLFVDRAVCSNPGFRLTRENAHTVAFTCRRLDGIPLAIELAAARVRSLSVGQIAQRLDDRFRLLSRGNRTAAPRHRTLRSAIDWSYLLLSEDERVLLRRLAVFSGGWTLEAAETVCARPEIPEAEVLYLLERLVDKSLVLAEERGNDTRYRLLETVRQYAADRLREVEELATAQERHRDWCLALAERAAAGLSGPEQVAWLERLEAEHDNFRAALAWSRTQASGRVAGLPLATALWWFWFMRGHWSEGRKWLEDTLSRCTSRDVSPEALLGTAYLAWRQGDYQRASALCDEALTLCEARGDRRGIAASLLNLGNIAAQQGAYGRSWRLSGRSLRLGRQLGDKIVAGWALAQRGAIARIRGDYHLAAAFYGESLAQVKAAGNPYWTAFVLRGLGDVAIKRGDHWAASAYYMESLTLSKALGDRWITEGCLAGLAAVACASGEYRRAARLFGTVEALREALGHHRTPADQADYDRLVASARARLGDVAFTEAWQAGRATTPDQAAERVSALERAQPGRSQGVGPRSPARSPQSLTLREQEVAALIARGRSNREISSALLITRRTAETHIQHILDKLGFTSRTQIVAWAIVGGLLESTPAPAFFDSPALPVSQKRPRRPGVRPI